MQRIEGGGGGAGGHIHEADLVDLLRALDIEHFTEISAPN